MSAKIVKRSDNRWEVVLSGEPSYCRSLPMAPPEMDRELRSGLWLVVLIAVWSGPDMAAMNVALSAVKAFSGRIQLGLRPFDIHKETESWCPALQKNYVSPLWLFLRDGEIREELCGIHSQQEIEGLIRQFINAANTHGIRS